MGWFYDAYSVLTNTFSPGVVTGKPIPIGGSLGRREATGRGVMVSARELLARVGKSAEGMTCAVQGFGNVGSVAAEIAYQMGMKVVGVSDVTGGLYNPAGLNIPALVRYADEHRVIEGYSEPGASKISNAELLELDVEMLIPAALQGQITEANAANIKAKYIVEGANGPTTAGADKILEAKGVICVPDIWPTPAASPAPTSSGSRTCSISTGRGRGQHEAGRHHVEGVQGSVGLRQGAQPQPAHRRIHAVHQQGV